LAPEAPREPAALLDLSGRVAVVTGAGAGLGREIARRFAAAGAAVLVHSHESHAGAAAVADAIRAAGGRAATSAGDLAQADAAGRLIAAAVVAFGRVDILVNNAGVYPMAPLLEITPQQWDAVLATNLRSAVFCSQAAARQIATQGGGGAIVNVTSIEALSPLPAHVHYSASKAGLEMLTLASAQELGPLGIRVNAVAPGLIRREGIESAWPDGVARWRAAAPLGRMLDPDEVADACLFLASPAARGITGASLRVDAGVMAAPSF